MWTLTLQLFLLVVLPTKQTDTTSLLGIDLRPEAQQLLREVGELYGIPVQVEIVESLPGGSHGDSEVLSDGTPRIRMRAATGRTEDNIVHELFHLKLRKEGFATLQFQFPLGHTLTEQNREAGAWINDHINDPILHFIFYPRMREMGLDPAILLETSTEEDIERGDYQGLAGRLTWSESTARAAYYFKDAIELDDDQLFHRIEQWYQDKGWSDSLSLGKRLAEIVLTANPQTPEDHIETLIRCLNVFYRNVSRFQLKEWTSSVMGAHTQKWAVITVFSPR